MMNVTFKADDGQIRKIHNVVSITQESHHTYDNHGCKVDYDKYVITKRHSENSVARIISHDEIEKVVIFVKDHNTNIEIESFGENHIFSTVTHDLCYDRDENGQCPVDNKGRSITGRSCAEIRLTGSGIGYDRRFEQAIMRDSSASR